MRCPKCGKNISPSEIAKELGRRGGSMKTTRKREAAFEREALKRDRRKKTIYQEIED